MSRNFFTDKWVLGAIAFLIVFGVACILWYHYDTAPYKRDDAKTAELLRQFENTNNMTTDESPTPAGLTTQNAEKPITIDSINSLVKDPIFGETEPNLTEQMPKTDKDGAGRVSPYGLGSYPEIPEGLFKDPSTVFDCSLAVELIRRVRIELFQHGIITVGGTIDYMTGLVYPTVKGEVYVTWGYGYIPGIGNQRYAVDIGGSRETMARIRNNVSNRESPIPKEIRQITEQDIPSDVVIKSHRTGIDPYKFLNLKDRTHRLK